MVGVATASVSVSAPHEKGGSARKRTCTPELWRALCGCADANESGLAWPLIRAHPTRTKALGLAWPLICSHPTRTALAMRAILSLTCRPTVLQRRSQRAAHPQRGLRGPSPAYLPSVLFGGWWRGGGWTPSYSLSLRGWVGGWAMLGFLWLTHPRPPPPPPPPPTHTRTYLSLPPSPSLNYPSLPLPLWVVTAAAAHLCGTASRIMYPRLRHVPSRGHLPATLAPIAREPAQSLERELRKLAQTRSAILPVPTAPESAPASAHVPACSRVQHVWVARKRQGPAAGLPACQPASQLAGALVLR